MGVLKATSNIKVTCSKCKNEMHYHKGQIINSLVCTKCKDYGSTLRITDKNKIN